MNSFIEILVIRNQITHLEPDWSLAFGTRPEIELRWVEERGDHLYVLGIVHSDISVGDKLTQVQHYAPQAVLADATPHTIAHVALRVKTITAFHNNLNRVPSDQTAGLILSGEWQGLTACLTQLGWQHQPGQYHQWCERVEDALKLTLAR